MLEHSAWVSLRAPRVQTSPIYVRVGLPPDFMEPIAPSVEAPCRMVRHVDGLINHLTGARRVYTTSPYGNVLR